MTKWRMATGLVIWAIAGIAEGEGQTMVDLRTQGKSVDFSGVGSTKPMQTGSSLPAGCAVGQLFFLTSAAAGGSVYACNPANTWTVQGNNLPVNPGIADQVLSNNGTSIQWQPLGGDVSGSPTGMTVSGLRGRSISSAAPASGQVLAWNTAANQWQPAAAQSGNSSYIFTSQQSITIPGTVHQFGTANLLVECYDNSTPPQRVEADKVQINPASYDVTVGFSQMQSGYCVVNGAGTAAVAGGGAVASVFGRGGAVLAQAGDYNFGQIGGTVSASQLPIAGGDLSGTLNAATVSGIQNRAVSATAPTNGQTLVWNSGSAAWQPATISAGVSSVFGRTGTITAQSGDYSFGQISGAVAAGQLPAAGGDVSGTLSTATVTGLQNRAVANTAPSNGQALVWNSTAGTWQPSNVSAGGASMAYQLGDLTVARTSGTVLSIGANCTSTSPCNVRFGYQVFNITNSATATISGSGTGVAYIYVTGTGTLVVGHNLTVACSAGCVQQSGITSFPANTIPLFTWTATMGTWDSAGGRDLRAFLSAKPLGGGQGILITEAPGQSTIAVDSGVIPTYLTSSATLNFPSIDDEACAPDMTLTVTGANPGDAVAPGWPELPAGIVGMMTVSSTNTVAVRLCNLSGSAVQPPSSTYRATIVRNY